MRLGWAKQRKNAGFQPIDPYISETMENKHTQVVTCVALLELQ